MKKLLAGLFSALFALATFTTYAAVQAKDGIVVADEEKTDGDKAPTDADKKDNATSQDATASGGGTASASDEEKTDGDKAPTTDTEKKDEEDKDKDKDGKKSD